MHVWLVSRSQTGIPTSAPTDKSIEMSSPENSQRENVAHIWNDSEIFVKNLQIHKGTPFANQHQVSKDSSSIGIPRVREREGDQWTPEVMTSRLTSERPAIRGGN